VEGSNAERIVAMIFAFTGAMWNTKGECVEVELRITWTELKWTTVIAAVEISKAVSPIVL